MTLEIGQLRIAPATAAPGGPFASRSPLDAPDDAPAARADSVELGVPAAPPPQLLAELAAAAARADELANANRELHFRADERSGRIIVEVRDLAGNVLRTIPPSKALDVMAGLYRLDQL